MSRVRRAFFALLGVTSAIAVGSFWWQLPGLSGERGIVPAAEHIAAMQRTPGLRFIDVPTLAWWSGSDAMLHGLCVVALLSAIALVLDLVPRAACLTLWASWLSLVQVCHPWLSFQWDILLVETAFCAAWYARPLRAQAASEPAPSSGALWVMRLLAFKVTFESGVVKLASHDASWRDLTALTYHWWSQPLPSWSSVLMAQAPLGVQMVLCALMFVFELVVPFLVLGPVRARWFGAIGLMALQLGIAATGNFSFYNLLTFVLAVPALDAPPQQNEGRASHASGLAVAAAYAVVSMLAFTHAAGTHLLELVRPFETVNAYGAFAVMTKNRSEIMLEGSADGVTWRPYAFRYKPSSVSQRPAFVAPWQPRLDWQMWFAALGSCESNPWVYRLQQRLLEGAAPVSSLFENDPFVGSTPPRYLRTTAWEYRFAPLGAAAVWWSVEGAPREYCSVVMLDERGRLVRVR